MPTGSPPGAATTWCEATLRALTLNSADIISVLDADGRLLFNSPAAERISGFSLDELSRVNTFELMHPEDRDSVARAFRQVLLEPGGTVIVRYRYRRKAGGWTWMEAVASNQLNNPEVRGIVANSRDISERVREEEARARREEQAVHQQRLEALGTLAGGIAHEFNNLLCALVGHVELIRAATSEPAVASELDDAREVIRRGTDLAGQLLGMTRRHPGQPTTVDAAELIEGLLVLLRRVLGVHIRVEFTKPSGPAWVRIDRTHFEQILLNLATNARDAMDSGGLLVITLERSPSGPDEKPEQAVVRLTDTGCGMSKETLDRAFEPFFTTKPIGRGTGLGLAITYGIVTDAGGSLRLESQAGKGTTAILSFPLAAAPEPPSFSAPPEIGDAVARPGERLLLADDDALVRRTTCRLLRQLGWEVDEVADGREAVDRIAAAPGVYAAALLDVRMPNMGGLEAARLLSEHGTGLPVLLLSGNAQGASSTTPILEKPFGVEKLGQRVRSVIDRREPIVPATG